MIAGRSGFGGSTAIAFALVLATACGSARRSEPLRGPLALEPAEQRGEVVFVERCHRCHPGGEAGLGPSLNDKPVPSAVKGLQVRVGLGAMPSFPEHEISDQELDDLLAYLAALRAHDGRVDRRIDGRVAEIR